MKVERNPLLPPIRVEDLGGKDKVAATITEVRVDVPTKSNKSGKALILVLKEFPKKGLYVNATGRDHLIDECGDESERWVGRKIAIGPVRTETDTPAPGQPKVATTVWVLDPAEWPKR